MLRRKKRAGLSRDGISDGKYELKKYFLLCYKNATNFFNPFSNTIAEAFCSMQCTRILRELSDGILIEHYEGIQTRKQDGFAFGIPIFFRPISIFIYPSLTFFTFSGYTYYRPNSVWTCSSRLGGLISTVAFYYICIDISLNFKLFSISYIENSTA